MSSQGLCTKSRQLALSTTYGWTRASGAMPAATAMPTCTGSSPRQSSDTPATQEPVNLSRCSHTPSLCRLQNDCWQPQRMPMCTGSRLGQSDNRTCNHELVNLPECSHTPSLCRLQHHCWQRQQCQRILAAQHLMHTQQPANSKVQSALLAATAMTMRTGSTMEQRVATAA